MKALITGGTGLLGAEPLASLQAPVVLSRNPARASRKRGFGHAIRWDPASEPAPLEALRGTDEHAGLESALSTVMAARRGTAA